MAGSKDIYIGEMLEEVVENISALQSSMSNDFTKLINGFEESASKQIAAMSNIEKNLAQVLANTGLTKNQKVYTGSDLTAITLNSSKWMNYFEKHGRFTITDNVIEAKALGRNNVSDIFITNLDFSKIKEIVVGVRSQESVGFTATMRATVKVSTGTILNKSVGYQQNSFSYDTIDVSDISDSSVYIKLENNSTSDDPLGLVMQMSFKDYEGNLIELESPVPVESILSYANNCITATGTAYGYSEFDLSSLGAAQYSDIFFRGTGGEIEVYDSNYNFVGESANGGINLVNLSTNKAILFYSFTEAGNISSIAFRYF